jgi:hypothetical protein
MVLSSRLCDRRMVFREESFVAKKSPQDVNATPGESDYRLGVSASLLALLQVVLPIRAGAHHARLSRQVENVPQRTAVAVRLMKVVLAPPRVIRDWDQTSSCGEVTGRRKRLQVAGRDQEHRTQDRPESGH